jgi:hypothetical protein
LPVSVEELDKAELAPVLTPLRVREHRGRVITNANSVLRPLLGATDLTVSTVG